MSLILNAANVLVSIAGTIAAETATAGAGAAITGLISLNEVLRRLAGKAPAINARIAADLQAEMASQHLSDTQRTLIPQMIERAPLTPSEVMAAARNPARIAEAMLTKHTDPAHRTPANADAFRRTVTPVLIRLLADQATSDALRPAFEDAVAESLHYIGEQVERMASQLHDTAYRLGVQDTLVLELTRRYAPGSEGDFTAAIRGLEQALQTAAQMQHTARLPQNTSDQVDAVLAEVDRLNRAGQLEAGAKALNAARAAARDRIARETSGLMRLLDSAVDQARLLNRPTDASEALVERLRMDGSGDFFNALCSVRLEWYVRGRDHGLEFDALVAIHLSEQAVLSAKSPKERGKALNELGAGLQTLGARERSPQRLQAAIAAYIEALENRDRKISPLEWAATQNNLGNALRALGEREPGAARLLDAIDAYGEALKERRQSVVPYSWAMTQNNLGSALRAVGIREKGTKRLKAAIAAYTAALVEYKQDQVPLEWAMTMNGLGKALSSLGEREGGTDRFIAAIGAFTSALSERKQTIVPLSWAMTQNNLGNALTSLGIREPGTTHLDAAASAFASALIERKRDLVPLDWAFTQFNLALLEVAYFDKCADHAHLSAAHSYVMAAREVFVESGAGYYVGLADDQLAAIQARATP